MYSKYKPSIIYTNTHATDLISAMFNLKTKSHHLEIFLSKDENEFGLKEVKKFKKVIVLNITSMSGEKQMWSIQKWRELVKSMPEYTFFQVGTHNEETVEGTINFLGKTNIKMAVSLLKHANSFVGVESFLAHATNIFETPGVVLFGDSSPSVWGHSNNINIHKNYSCSPCVDLTSKCPYGIECMNDITVSEVREALLSQIKG